MARLFCCLRYRSLPEPKGATHAIIFQTQAFQNAAAEGQRGGYKLGPRAAKPVPVDAKWMTSNQLRARYGNRSHMWLYRNLKNNPDFPRPSYDGRMQVFNVKEFDEYDRKLLSKRSE